MTGRQDNERIDKKITGIMTDRQDNERIDSIILTFILVMYATDYLPLHDNVEIDNSV